MTIIDKKTIAEDKEKEIQDLDQLSELSKKCLIGLGDNIPDFSNIKKREAN